MLLLSTYDDFFLGWGAMETWEPARSPPTKLDSTHAFTRSTNGRLSGLDLDRTHKFHTNRQASKLPS